MAREIDVVLSQVLGFCVDLSLFLSLFMSLFLSLFQFNLRGFIGMGNIMYVHIAKASEIDNELKIKIK